jgi:hypothetical protein
MAAHKKPIQKHKVIILQKKMNPFFHQGSKPIEPLNFFSRQSTKIVGG